jgi:hypothetical protein
MKKLEKCVKLRAEKKAKVDLSPGVRPVYYMDDSPGAKELDMPADKPEPNSDIKMLSSLKILDDKDHDGKPIMMYTEDDEFAFCKCGVGDRIGKSKWIKKHSHTLKKAMAMHLNMARGKKKRGRSCKYICSGYRKDPLTKKVSYYAFEQWASNRAAYNLKIRIRKLVSDIEEFALNYLLASDLSAFAKIREEGKLEDVLITGAKGKFTQMALAKKYWSPLHLDDDFFPTALSCYSPSSVNSGNVNEILYYFVFPTLGVAVPMRSMDMLVFNSRIPHCATNYRKDDAYIFSFFTSAKTTLTQTALTKGQELEQSPDERDNKKRKMTHTLKK